MHRACLLFLLPFAGWAAEADEYDPILDGPPTESPEQRLRAPEHPGHGFTVSGHLGMYAGRVQSYLTDELSTLRPTAPRLAVGFGIGYRTSSFVELGVDLDLGLGQTWSPAGGVTEFAFDVVLDPRVIMHAYETESFSLYAGPSALVMFFDMGGDGVNQAGIGPAALLGVLYRWDRPRHSPAYGLVFLEGEASYFYDSLAYRYEDPSEEELMEDPTAEPKQVVGDWFPIFRVTVGYRLTSF
jgi:hypothetical protein